ncbi:MAG: hypothetical protein AB199_00895 [Parcubacteria bacterium C7867-004]|nr:MAG: hypothetical protein AB199_00895 [Parcubacteria bacterium C7867-004]
MQAVLSGTRLEIVSWCHLLPVQIKLPHIPIDHVLFPSAKEGFEGLSMMQSAGRFGSRMALVDISGLTCKEVRERMNADHGADMEREVIDFLRCLEFIQSEHCDPFPFERIVAYISGADAVIAVRSGTGFSRTAYLGPQIPWDPGTLGLFFIDSL